MELEFITELCESRLIRQKKQIKQFTAKDAADLVFLYCCTLTILKNEFKYAPVASSYAKKTVMFNNWDVFRMNGTDLYVLLVGLVGTDDTSSLFSDKEASQLFVDNVKVNQIQLKTWFRFTGKARVNKSFDSQFLFRLERQLQVNNSQYKSIRRLASDWANLKHGQKTLVITRILQAFRARARRSELMPFMVKLAKEKKYDSNKPVRDMEKVQPANTKGGMSTRSKIALGVGLVGAGTYGAYRLGKHLTGRQTPKRSWKSDYGRHGQK
ncbi:uncharacterized protein METZ01_LOCUS333639 [marine metagenome]|uniref:Uncharacterized protein n=1 Tax=marine metagenome TaxID=408172 RepID=A0A382Q776_9ZZZZ